MGQIGPRVILLTTVFAGLNFFAPTPPPASFSFPLIGPNCSGLHALLPLTTFPIKTPCLKIVLSVMSARVISAASRSSFLRESISPS